VYCLGKRFSGVTSIDSYSLNLDQLTLLLHDHSYSTSRVSHIGSRRMHCMRQPIAVNGTMPFHGGYLLASVVPFFPGVISVLDAQSVKIEKTGVLSPTVMCANHPNPFFRLSPEDVTDPLAPRSLSGRRRELSATSESFPAVSATDNHSSRCRVLHRRPRTSRGFVVSCVCSQTRVWAVSSQNAPMLHDWGKFFVPSVCFSLPQKTIHVRR
jgi:hypothetical protein